MTKKLKAGRVLVALLAAFTFIHSSHAHDSRRSETPEARLAQLVEANIIAVHAFQVLLAKNSGKGQTCFAAGNVSEADLNALSEHQASLLKSDIRQVQLWVQGRESTFNPAQDLQPILSAALKIPADAPVNVFTRYLRQNTKASEVKVRSIASLYQTVLEVERDGDRLQEEFAFYIGLGLPVYVGQLNLPGTDADLLAVGRQLEGRSCAAPVGTSAAEWQIAGRKIWNWGEKNLHIRDERVLAAELLQEPEVKSLEPALRALPAQKIAVVGHSFTMGLHWSSPSSFVPIVIDVFRRENPKVQFKQYAAGGLTASRAQKRFYPDVLAWKPDKVLLVVMTRTDEDYEALKQMGQGLRAAGIKPYMFDEVHDPAAVTPGTVERARKTAAEAGIEVIEVSQLLANSPDRAKFICLDGIHMTEPYHRLMAKEWLKYLAGTRGNASQPALHSHVVQLVASPQHPRMLIGENDPLTGFKVLRARYEAGARPPDDLDGWALSYLLTGDESFAKRAVQKMRETHPPEQVGSRTYPEYVKWSLAFDWLYNYPGFDNELKDRVAGELLSAAEKMLQDQSLKEVQLAMYHNYTVRYLTLALFALTAIEGHSTVESRAAPLRKHARNVLDHILDLTNFITPDGGYHESMDYQRITFAPLAMMAELLRTTANSDPALRYTLFQHYTDTYLYKVLPDGTTARDDDNEFPYLQWEDNICFGYAINRFKDPYAAWLLRKSGWPAQPKWRVAITQFLWDDPNVTPRNPADSTSAEIARAYFFRGIGHLVMRDGFGPDSTWIQFNSGPYLGKHDHLDQNHFVIYHKGYLATESGADYTDTESPHYLNYYRRTIAHNSMLVYQTGEKFFWAENLWPAANDGGQRMDSSRYWNTVRSREDFERTRDLWATGHMEVTDIRDGSYVYARGNATNAYQPSKMERFTREVAYTPANNVLVIFDRVRTTDPSLRKVWLLHGVGKPVVTAAAKSKDVGHGGTEYPNAATFTYEDGNGRLRVHSLLPREREVVTRGGPGWEFWTPGDEFGGAWGSGKNWPLDPAAGGPLPTDPYLRKMWKTFWGDDFEKLLPSNTRAVVPAAWRVEVSPAKPAPEDFFLHVLEIGDKGDPRAPKVELVDGVNLIGALIEGGTVTLFATGEGVVIEGEVTIPDVETANLLISGLRPHAKYELQMTGGRANWRGGLFNGVPAGTFIAAANESGVLYVPFKGQKDGRLRLRMLATR
ncbi:MAG TPA: heparinase II/III family protein [Pyrinomonadaceae bacterium]|nr:heparinase II/III family protein [Pyrinomonadaceae bacterium]